jgi:hypothetical protein
VKESKHMIIFAVSAYHSSVQAAFGSSSDKAPKENR